MGATSMFNVSASIFVLLDKFHLVYEFLKLSSSMLSICSPSPHKERCASPRIVSIVAKVMNAMSSARLRVASSRPRRQQKM
mmetsp:Transcript_14279/g.41209  ORF Transcript_14279/g.41209 Transcript_14279/m.41209 type:complete len:81 (-) Transcript_14279:661-903(-)